MQIFLGLYLGNARAKSHHTRIEARWGRALSNKLSHKDLRGLGREIQPFQIGVSRTSDPRGGGALPSPATLDFDQEPGEDLTIKIWACCDFPFSSYEWICTEGAWPKCFTFVLRIRVILFNVILNKQVSNSNNRWILTKCECKC